MSLKIEGITIKHLDRLYKIEKECFEKEAFTKQQIASLLTDYNSVSLVAKLNDRIAGFVIGTVYFDRNASFGHIATIDVSPEHRRKGIAQKLLLEIEKIFKEKNAKTAHLEVRESNIAALKLYQKLGYKKVARLDKYYGNAHGIYLKKDLT